MRKSNKRFVVIGCSDARYGDFVASHWVKSLKKNVDLRVVDIVLLNYGLTEEQKRKIISERIIIVDCIKDGHIVNLRYRDMLNFLIKHKYEQVLACDSGDIIFQKNIMSLFYKNPNLFKAVSEDLQPPTLEYSLIKGSFSDNIKKKVLELLKGKKMVNGGLIVAPSNKFKKLCESIIKFIKRKDSFGPDQIVLNYFLYKEGFVDIGSSFNYIPVTANEKFSIKNGIFYNSLSEVISIVHNAGNYSSFRAIKNFGYGKSYNRFSFLTYILLRTTYRIISAYRWIKNKI